MRYEPVSTSQTRTEGARYKVLRDRLLAEIPDLDAETLADTLEEITDLKEMLAELIRSALEDEALAAGLSTRLSDMKARLERLRGTGQAQAPAGAEDHGRGRDCQSSSNPTLRPRCGKRRPALEVVAEDKIPAAYWKPQPLKLDRQGLLRRSRRAPTSRARLCATPICNSA